MACLAHRLLKRHLSTNVKRRQTNDGQVNKIKKGGVKRYTKVYLVFTWRSVFFDPALLLNIKLKRENVLCVHECVLY